MADHSIFKEAPTVAMASPDGESDQSVHHLGYRGWSGERTPLWTRWIVISKVGIRRSWENRWLKRLLFFAWLPAVWFGLGFFLWEQAANYPEWRQIVTPMIQNLPPDPVLDEIKEAVQSGTLAKARHTVWSWLLNAFIRYPQPVLMVLVIGLISPPLISQDIRSRAFLLYFSRPLTRGEYLLGKMATLWAYLALITTVPALTQYAIGVVLSPNLGVIAATWDIPFRILAASVVLMLPTSALALCFSSLTQESRNAAFAWFAIWILGWFTYGAVSTAEAFNTQQEFQRHARDHRFRQRGAVEDLPVRQESVWTHLSLYHTLGRVQSWIFGFSKMKDVLASIAILVVITCVSLVVLFYRVSAPMRV